MTQDTGPLPRALAAFEASRHDDSIDAALVALSDDPSDSDRHAALVVCGRAFAAKAMHGEAIAYFDRAIASAPDSADAYCWRGRSYYQQERDQLARLDYERALEIDPDDARAFYHRGLLQRAAGDHDFAIADFDRAVDDDTIGVEARMYRGLSRLDAGDRVGAKADLVAAARERWPRAGGWLDHHFHVGDSLALIAVARHYRFSGHPEDGLGAIGRALAIGYDTDEHLLAALLENGHLHNAARQWSNALEAFDSAFELCPDDKDAETYRARALYNLERDDEAESAYVGALRRYPDDNRLHRFYAELLMVSGRTAEATTAFSSALDANPGDPLSWFQRGVCHQRLADHDAAKRDFLEAGRLGERRAIDRRIEDYGPETGHDYFQAGSAALDRGDLQAALDDLDRAIHLLRIESRADGDYAHRHMVSAMSNRGYALTRMGSHRAAIDELVAAADMRPELAAPWKTLGNAFNAEGRYDDALDAFGRFIALQPRHPDGFYDRAQVHALTGEADLAIADLDTAIAIGYRSDDQLIDALFNRARTSQSAGRLVSAMRDYERLDALGYGPAFVLVESIANVIEHAQSASDDDEYPFRFYGTRPAHMEEEANGAHRYRLVFRDAPDTDARARIADAFETAAYGALDTTYGSWRWSGTFAAFEVGEMAVSDRDAHFDAIEAVLHEIHRVHPLEEVVYLDAQAASYGEWWERWTLAQQPVPTAAPNFADFAHLWVDAPGDVRDFDAIANDHAFEHARREARAICARDRAADLAETALAAGDIALVPIAAEAVPSTDELPASVAGQLRDADVARIAATGAGIIMRRVGGYYRALDRVSADGSLHSVESAAGNLSGPSVRPDGAVAAIAIDRTVYEIDLATGDVRRVIELDPRTDNAIESTAYVGADRIAAQTKSRMVLIQRGTGADGGTVVSSRPCGTGFTTPYRNGSILIASSFDNGPSLYVYGADGDELTTLAELETAVNGYTVRVADQRVVARGPSGHLELCNLPEHNGNTAHP
jgi:tetratricopeptide (TPR) repeat protein